MKRLPVAAAVLAALTSYSAFAADSEVKATDMLTDGWEIHGYGSMNYRMKDGQSFDTELGKPDYRSVGTSGKSSAQVEFVIKKHTEYGNGVYSDFIVRSEYGNGDSYYYSSPGNQKANNVAQFEVKEAYVALGNLPYLPENSEIWAGRRYLNRAAGGLSGEFWKQSSGQGAGIETKFDNGQRGGIAVISADPEAGTDTLPADGARHTVTSVDLYYYGVQALGGSFDFDLKWMYGANEDPKVGSDPADRGIGGAITYNRDYYGFNGWSQTGIAYGTGMAANRGVNFGSWSNGWKDDSKSLFATTYGVATITDTVQLGTELTYWAPENMGWADSNSEDKVTRYLIAARPSIKLNDNFRLEFTGSYAMEKLEGDNDWGRADDTTSFYTLEAATVFTVNADYFGRPQIKPYVTWVATDDENAAGSIGITDKGEKSQTVFGIHAEIWF